MTQPLYLAAVDLGNESGRIIRISYDGANIASEEIYRFANHPVAVTGTLYWDILRLWHEIQQGLDHLVAGRAAGIGVDSFGVDFGLLDAQDKLISNPVHMRDARTAGMMEWVAHRIPNEELYRRTGTGFYVINTLYQLVAISQRSRWQLDTAQTLLTMPNLINFWLTGEKRSEFTHSTTTQCYSPSRGDWDAETLDVLGIPPRLFPSIIQPGTQLGTYEDTPVFTVASHDTASAVVAVPAETSNYVYISSGTWSLFGVESDAPITTPEAMRANFTNEGGTGGQYRTLKMVMGLWILQQCRALWREQGINTEYDVLIPQAQQAEPFASLFDPDDPVFFPPGDMPARIRAVCERTKQTISQSPGEFVRSIMESLALKYRYVLDEVIAVTGRPIEVIHIVGGGARNEMLCQMTANATGLPVLAGPIEATALGNGLVQLIALGELKDVAEARRLIRASQPIQRYHPQPEQQQWQDVYQRFKNYVQPMD